MNRLFLAFLILCLAAGCAPAPTAAPTPTPLPTAAATPESTALQQYGEPLQNLPAHVVLYEVNLRAFSASGDLAGVTARLDELKALGVNTIWLMPIYPIGKINSVNSPYSVQDYLAVNPEFGTLDDLRALTDAAHQRGIAVILDWVANHTAWDNPWIKNKDWYTQKDGKIISPEGTGWADVADLNYDNAEMRAAMIEAMTYWVLEANVDGFRCDAADMVPFDFWQEAISTLNSIPGRKLIWLAEGSREDHFTAGFQMNYAWNFYNQLKGVFTEQPATGLYTTHLVETDGLPSGARKLRFTTNHDESAWDASPVALFGGIKGALAASVIAAYMGGVPMIYDGQEVGRADTTPFFSKSPIDWSANPDMLAAYKAIFKFYNESPALQGGSLTDCSTADVVCFTRATPDQEVLVIVNVRNKTLDFALPARLQNTSWQNAFSGRPLSLQAHLSLEPYAYVVARR